MIDLLVAGGGPTGLVTAIAAARAGLEAVVVEPRVGAIDKACGEGLMPPAVRALAALGVEIPVSHPFFGIRYVDGARWAEGSFGDGPGLGVRRTTLHAALRARADAVGVRVVEGRVEDVLQRSDHVEAAGMQARWLAAADGLQSPLRRRLGLELPPRLPARLGVRRHFRTKPWADRVEVHWADGAEAYVTPVGDDLVGIAVLYQRDGAPGPDGRPPFDRWLDRFPALRDQLGEPASQPRGAGPFEQRVKQRVVGRVLLVGDAAGYLDPITGEGIRLGIAASQHLVCCIAANRPQDYEAAWRGVARRYWWMTSGLLWVGRQRALRRRLVAGLRWTPGVMSAALWALTRD